jgi:hypothetical protein
MSNILSGHDQLPQGTNSNSSTMITSSILAERIYPAIILNEPYAAWVKQGKKKIETRTRLLTKLVGDVVFCCDKGKSKNSKNAGNALCIVSVESGRLMLDKDEEDACIENAIIQYAYPLSNLRHFSYDFKFSDYAITKNWQGIFKIKIPDFVEIKNLTNE